MAKRKTTKAAPKNDPIPMPPEDCGHIWKRLPGTIKVQCVDCGTLISVGSLPKDATWYDPSAKEEQLSKPPFEEDVPAEEEELDLDSLFPADATPGTEDGDAK